MPAPPSGTIALVWLRRDLRLEDQPAICAALEFAHRIHLAFVFDREILDPLGRREDRRVEFIRDSLVEIDAALRERGGALHWRHGRAREEIPALARALGADVVVAARDYEPLALERDAEVARRLDEVGIAIRFVKDHAIFEPQEILTAQGNPYSVFTPYRRAWMSGPLDQATRVHDASLDDRIAPAPAAAPLPSLAALGFAPTNLRAVGVSPGAAAARSLLERFATRIGDYERQRDFPAVRGPSYLSVHLRFGTVSVRAAARLARETIAADAAAAGGAHTWLSELAWRDFYLQILAHRPDVVDRAFRPEFDALQWVDDDEGFAAWCEGRTGYPIVDAAMAQLRHSGYMHNRLRMIVASFLTKDLGIDWRRGERYFAAELNDFDLAANNGGWQWAASTGCDAQPYFRIFNPVTQSERFDPQGRFIARYLPALARLPASAIHAPWRAPSSILASAGIVLGRDYPRPIVDHASARTATLARFARALSRRA